MRLQGLHVVLVNVSITHQVNKLVGLMASEVGNHVGEGRVGSNVEGDAKTPISRALVEDAGQAFFF